MPGCQGLPAPLGPSPICRIAPHHPASLPPPITRKGRREFCGYCFKGESMSPLIQGKMHWWCGGKQRTKVVVTHSFPQAVKGLTVATSAKLLVAVPPNSDRVGLPRGDSIPVFTVGDVPPPSMKVVPPVATQSYVGVKQTKQHERSKLTNPTKFKTSSTH